MSKIVLKIEYNGSNYHGFQRQKNDLATIELKLEQALSLVANHEVKLICAGRTDAGVHATGQIIHFETSAKRSNKSWCLGANTNLPADISVIFAKELPADFHARFSALARRYWYVIYLADFRPALLSKNLTWQRKKLDIPKMQQAANFLVGEHDFSSFRGSDCQAHSPIRTIYDLKLRQLGNLLIIDIKANAFLQHMVRNIAGLLMAIGSGAKQVEFAKYALNLRTRCQEFVTAHPFGLYLVDVEYPAKYELNLAFNPPYFLPLAN